MQDYNKEEVRVEEKYAKAAREILECMGGKDNIASAAHCATRLRLVLKDESLINKDALEEIDLVKGNFNNGGQFQIILGRSKEHTSELQSLRHLVIRLLLEHKQKQ